ncbi:MAG: outer rane efflux protein, partial [Gemmatimonadetes bacterium]|nr:outer rane efflux protein [Gemmatimonadota bacterium]
AAVLAPFAAVAAAAQQPAAPAGGLTLDAVVQATLRTNPGVEIARLQVDGARGLLLGAGGVFDPRFTSSLTGKRSTAPALDAAGLVSAAASPVTNTGAYGLGGAWMLRSGITLLPEVTVSRSEVMGVSPAPAGGGSVKLGMSVPLLRDRFGRLSASGERAARAALDAQSLSVGHATATGLLTAVSAYWAYRGAQERLEVYRDSEQRAGRLLEETRALVRADERPAGDLNQLMANLSAKRVTRIAAEQAVVVARRDLGLAMGAEPEEVMALPPAADGFPAPVRFDPDTAALRAMVHAALERRADLAAAGRQTRSAEAVVQGTRSGLKPRLDLNVTAGYAGLATGQGFGSFVEPLYRNVPGLSATVALQYELPVANTAARGQALQSTATLQEQRVSERDLARRVASGVVVAAEALRRSALSLAEADEEVRLYATTLENERRKSQLGVSTLLDVLTAADGLTGAMLNVVSSRQSYAVSIATLRWETGTLAAAGPDGPALAGSLSTPP